MYIAIIVAITLTLLLFPRRFFYPTSDVHKIPGPWPWPIIGSPFAFKVTAERVIPLINDFQKKFGNLFLLWVGPIPVINVSSPAAAEAILSNKKNIKKGRAYKLLQPWLGLGLLTSTGSRWFSKRRLITPTFHFSILETFMEIFQENSRTLVDGLKDAATNGISVELQPFITRCTLDIICEAAMGTKINSQKQSQSESETDVSTSSYIRSIFRISQLTTVRMLNFLIRPSPIFFRLPVGHSYMKHLTVVHDFTKDVIQKRREAQGVRNGEGRRAFLDLLLDVKDQDGFPLSDEDIREEVDTFMFEGHDTTAAGLVWTLYLLGSHPEIQEEIFLELQDLLGDGDKVMTISNLAEMKKLERAIKESLRLYPSVPAVTREIEEELDIEGYRIPVGSALILHIYQLHRNPDLYPDPEKFDPDRFLPEKVVNRHPFAYIPFSAGSRNCIGQKFAMLEEKVILATILLSYKVTFLGKLNSEQIKSELVLRPPRGLKFTLTKRKQ